MFRFLIQITSIFLIVLGSVGTHAHSGNSTGDYYEAPLTPSRFISYQGLNVAVYESVGTQGPGILMIHGNTSSANSYLRVFNSQFAQNFKVVLVDLPGYGKSDNATAAQYNVAFFAGAIQTVAQQTGTDTGVLVGWSLGAFYATQAMPLLSNLKGVFLFGDAVTNLDPSLPPPFLTPQQSYAGDAVNFGVVGPLTPIQITDYANAFFRPNFGRVPGHFLADAFRADPETRNAVLRVVTGQDPFVDPVNLLQNTTVPVALVNGKQDAFVNNARYAAIEGTFPTLFRGKAILRAKTGHAFQYERPVVFNSILRQFVNSL